MRAPSRAIIVSALVVLTLAACNTGDGSGTFTTTYPPTASGDDPVKVSVIDQLGIVTGLVAAPGAEAAADVESVPGAQATLRVRWLAGECVDRVTMVLNSLGATYELAIHDHEGFAAIDCTDAIVTRVVDITFSKSVEPAELVLRIAYP